MHLRGFRRRRPAAVRERASEDVREWFKERHWTHLYVVPLAPDTAPATVKAFEARIGRRLKPTDNWRLRARLLA